MNKVSKRAIKTTATVGMSLAMVLSGVTPAMAAPIASTCEVANTVTECKNLLFDLAKAIDSIGLAELTVNSTATINGKDDTPIIASIIINKAGLEASANGTDYMMLRKWMDVVNVIAADTSTDATAKGMFSTAYFADDSHDATTGGLVNFYNAQLSTEWSEANIKSNAAAAVKAYDKMVKWTEDGHYDRLDDTLSARFDVVFNDLEERVSDYLVDDSDVTRVFVAAWSTVLEQDLAEKGTITFPSKDLAKFQAETKLESGVSKTINLSSKSEINARIKAIKDAPNYYRVKNDSSVKELIAQYEDLLENITDLKDLLKDESYKAFTSTKTKDEEMTVKSFLSKVVYKETTDLKKAKELAKQLDQEQYAILKDLKEDVLDNAYTFETKKVGDYYIDKSTTISGFTGDATVKRDLGVANDYLLSLVDNKEGLFGIDVVLNYMEDFTKAYAAATSDIASLTPANIKGSDKAKLEAAEDAYYEMTAVKGLYKNNLTEAQTKELRRINTKVENLREAFDKLGYTNTPGWVDMGNGNWNYNNEDGTPAAYKWVAAGKDWYFVRDGKMVRNSWLAANSTDWYYLNNDGTMATSTTVEGYWINSLGIYRR